MSYSEAITKNDLTEILTQLGIGVSFGQMYHADWTATSSSSTPYQVTGSITLPKGKYLAIISIPVCSQETVLYFYFHSLGAQKSIVHGFSQSKHPVLFELTETTTIWVETGMSQSTTYSYLERGGLDVICLSDLKQYGTTVLDYYPVGSYYETSDVSFNPNTAWGGTWVKENTDIVERKKLMWTNSGATTFAAQTISMDLSNYTFVEVEFYASSNTDIFVPNRLKIRVGENDAVVLMHNLKGNGTNENTGARRINVSTSGVAFTDYTYKNRRTDGTLTVANQFCVPYRIYAIDQLTMYRWHRTA